MHGMILAAGFGTRLAELGLALPKPLFPVCNVPLIRWAVSFLVGHGITDIVVNLHHRGGLIQDTLGDGAALGARITYSIEEGEILGTGGGIKAALPLLGSGPFVVMNGKIVSDVDLWAAIAHHRATLAQATMVLKPDPDAARWGAIGVDPAGRIRRFLGAPSPVPPEVTEHMFTGIHVLEPDFVAALPEGPCCIVRAGYRPAFDAGRPLAGYVHRGYFWDHSTPERWLRGNLNLVTAAASAATAGPVAAPVNPATAQGAQGAAPVTPMAAPAAAPVTPAATQGAAPVTPLAAPAAARFAPTPLCGVHPEADVDPSAQLDPTVLVGPGASVGPGARLGPAVVLGPGARVEAGARLSHALVYAGATARGEIHDAIVTGDSQVYSVDPDGAGPRTGPALGATRSGS